ncbi:acyl-CoA dehydrogenase family protein [Nitrospirillum bahiense]|uniref:Alkylation response protein AidB-like acyl-CoA dehydrogenase n=1 Tax=Nitrospirillum amazonense TaxID=28077 RepID=A0A560FVK7_9PROT|nr:acyl-CoA dehydrogenase family protein [Nitrospirillum amazonense]TWB25683.1 alkylation response protein AidB-like acyl-CoA dehydrogenase [Nitrospirillum amazonense]
MDFTLTDEQKMLADVVAKLLDDHCPPAALRQLMTDGAPRDAARWGAIVETGLVPVLVPAEQDGLGLGELDFALIAQACGRAALPEPLVDHAGIALPLLAACAPAHPLLAEALSGAATLAIGHPLNPLVADADMAAALLLVHEGDLHLVPRDQVTLTRRPSIDPFRRLFDVAWKPSGTTRIASAATAAEPLADAIDRGALFAAAQCLGLAQRCVDLAVAYAKDRTQFGKPIGSYQAIKHHLASVQVKIEFARPVLHAAATRFPDRDTRSRAAISHAKLVAAEAADLAARTAIQVHGAMGYSWEVDIHFFLKRALALTYVWGTPAFHQARVERRVLAGPLGPDQTFLPDHPRQNEGQHA